MDEVLTEAQAIADRFALGTAESFTGPHACGRQGELWRLQTEHGPWAVHRRCTYALGAELNESAALQHSAHRAGIATPPLRQTVDGQVMANVGMGLVRVEGWIDLADSDSRVDPLAAGKLAGALHRLPCRGALRFDPWFHAPVETDRWGEIVEECRAVRAPFADQVAALAQDLIAIGSLVTAPTQPQICHRDLSTANLRRGPAGLVWVIGWHSAGLTDPAHELAALLFDHADGATDRARAIRDAYVEAGGPARMSRPTDFSMLIARRGHELEMACRRWLSMAASAADRAGSEAAVTGFVARPLTRSVIDTILDATA